LIGQQLRYILFVGRYDTLMTRGAVIMHPETAKTLVEQRREELIGHMAPGRQVREARSSWRRRHLPHWHVSWTRTVLSPAGGPGTAGSGHPDRPGQRGSSVVIIISAYR
jgi:hypothetical protein